MAESQRRKVEQGARTSRVPGFYKLTVAQRLERLCQWQPLSADEKRHLCQEHLPLDKADMMIENVIGIFGMPLGVATNFLINGKDYLVPMAVEETSIVAAAGNSAQLIRENGTLTAKCEGTVMEGQIQLTDVPNIDQAIKTINESKDRLLKIANEQDRMLVSLGGGAKDLYCRKIETESGPMLIVHLSVDVRDAMGANAVNTMVETLGSLVADMSKGDLHLRIITNLCDRSLTRARFEVNVDCLKWGPYSGRQVAERLVRAYHFADADPYRATTHNKGIMNGIDGILIATGNDWRAVEAGCHAYAARTGRYRSLTRYHIEGDKLVGEIELPIAVGLVGGVTKLHPVATIALKLLGVTHRSELAEVIACAGLLQNFAAMRALCTAGIQKGHMALHARNVACFAGADGELAVQVAEQMEKEGKVTFDRARQIIAQVRGKSSKALLKAVTEIAPAKLILLGEHAVVYGQPAIAVPLTQLCAEATVMPTAAGEPLSVALEDFQHHSGKLIAGPSGGILGTGFNIPPGISIVSPDFPSSEKAGPFLHLLQLVAASGKVPDKGWRLQLRSRIPIGCGLGSSAAVCAASFRAIYSAFNIAYTPEQLAELVYGTERVMHGTPSGIDNTVIALERPVFFQRGAPFRLLQMPASEAFVVVGYSGVRHNTHDVVADVRKAWEADKAKYDAIFQEIGQITRDGVKALEAADWKALGELMNRNQTLLERMGVSSEKLETLIGAARKAGALGAKLSGAGRGGCMVALAADAEQARRLQSAIEQAGAPLCFTSSIAR